jgi:hypothetical protein
MEVNKATGEVTSVLAGEKFTLHATLPRVAALQAALSVNGFGAMFQLIQDADVRAVYHGLRTLCASGNAAKLDAMSVGAVIGDGVALVLAALTAGMPEPDEKKAAAGTRTSSPGRDSGQ